MSESTGSRQRVLEYLDKIGYKDMTVAELVKQLVQLPPMMNIFAIDHSHENDIPLWFNGIDLANRDNAVPSLYLHVSNQPEKQILPSETYEELLAKKKEQALEMEKEKQQSTEV